MITDERLSDLYFEVLGVRLAEFDAVPVHAFMRAVEKLARQDEREACADIVEGLGLPKDYSVERESYLSALEDGAAAIRARSAS